MLPFTPAMIFDMDGTLIDNMPYHNQIWTSYLAELGAAMDPGSFHQLAAGKTNPEILRLYLGEDLSDADAEKYAEEKARRYRRLYAQEVRPLPGLEAFIERARRAGIKLALATSAGRENIDFVLSRIGLSDAFQAVVSAEDVTRGKPDPQAFLLAARHLGVDPRDCLVFEDAPKGVEAAHRAGMRVVALLTSMSEAEARGMPGVIHAANDYTKLSLNGAAK